MAQGLIVAEAYDDGWYSKDYEERQQD